MPDFHDPSRLLALGHDWIAAWNARDLERVLAMYAEDTEMTSDRIPAFGFGASGTVRGKAQLRAYWSAALAKLPELHFELIDLYRRRPTASWCSTRTNAARRSASICGSMIRARSGRVRAGR